MKIDAFEESALQAICNILGATDTGLSGTEIGRLLASCHIDDPAPGITKRYRLFEALSKKQRADGCGNNVINFIKKAMSPVSYINRNDCFESRRSDLNEALAFAGLSIRENGEIHQTPVVKTLSEAEKRAHRLKKQLMDRKVHPDVLQFCRAELLQENYFHGVFEATKSIADKIRDKAGLISDGATLVDEAFGMGSHNRPKLAFNSLQTETERNEHKGFMNLIKGLFGAFRNTTAHAPKIKWQITEEDALDILTLASMIQKKLDVTVNTNVRPI